MPYYPSLVVASLVLLGVAIVDNAASQPPKEPAARHQNRLAREKSPYLLQHADNPVDWYPWGEEAFEAARRAGAGFPVPADIGVEASVLAIVSAVSSHESSAFATAGKS